MARILVEVGQASGEKVFGNQQKAATTLLAFYDALGLGPAEASNADKLEAVAAHLAKYVVSQVRQSYVSEQEALLQADADGMFGVD
jgi:hypothetical protein